MVDRSSGAGYTPPKPVIDEQAIAAVTAAAEKARNNQEMVRAGISLMTVVAVGGLAAYNPALGAAAAPLLTQMQGIMLSGNPTPEDATEFARLAVRIRELFQSAKGE